MDLYEPLWGDSFKVEGVLNSITSPVLLVNTSMENKVEYIPHESGERSGDSQETTNKDDSKVRRRLAQNREAARKSRLRKKAYVQQLETSRLKLMQLELEIEKARKQAETKTQESAFYCDLYIPSSVMFKHILKCLLQGLYTGRALDASYMGSFGTINQGIVAFRIEYGHWIEEQHRWNEELRNAFQTHASDEQFNQLVISVLNHYANLFRMKAEVAKADVFYLISGVWKASVERIVLWIGGSRPSQLLNIIVPQLEPLTDQQIASINKLRLSSQQAEDALSQGLDKLQQSLVLNIAVDPLMAVVTGKIEALEGFVNQADHLRQQTLIHMSRILSPHQAAQGLLALGEYFDRLRALSSLWAARPYDAILSSLPNLASSIP